MAGINKAELWRELDATDEAFVRQKHAIGGYGQAKGRIVAQWVASQDVERQVARSAAEGEAARITAFWTRFGALAAAAAVLVSLILAYLPKAS